METILLAFATTTYLYNLWLSPKLYTLIGLPPDKRVIAINLILLPFTIWLAVTFYWFLIFWVVTGTVGNTAITVFYLKMRKASCISQP